MKLLKLKLIGSTLGFIGLVQTPAQAQTQTQRQVQTQTPISAPEKVTLRADDWCPFTCVEKDAGGKKGIISDIAEEALKAKGYNVEYKVINWARALDGVQKGQFNALLGAYKDDVPGFIFPKDAQYNSKDCFWVREGEAWKYSNYESLKGKKIGVALGYGYGASFDAFKETAAGKKIIQSASGDFPMDQNYKKLMSQRIDGFLENLAVIEFRKKTKPELGKLVNAGCLESHEIFVAFSPVDKQKSEKYKLAVDEFMKDKAKVQKIYDKYK